mmetsp:Transcript_5724/g.8042  ORF Transcript_5724/g.8042 Transcript_5724/m.8042 type:complete len:300 (-) Transcript_5724:217-1116(-)
MEKGLKQQESNSSADRIKRKGGHITKDMLVKAAKMTRSKTISDVEYLKKITHLHLAEKKISTLQNAPFELCSNLRVLYLHDNNISKMVEQPLKIPKVTHLYLQNNEVDKVEGLQKAASLSKLYLSGNKISTFEGLEHCSSLSELHLSDQNLEDDCGKSSCMEIPEASLRAMSRTLTTLTVANAGITTLEPFLLLNSLERLDASRNKLDDIKSVCRYLDGAVRLSILDLRGNPICKARKYREMLVISSHIENLDGKDILDQERQFLIAMKAKRGGKKASSKKHNENSKQQKPMFQIGKKS